MIKGILSYAILVLVGLFFLSAPTSAKTFSAGNIIDDLIFTNSNAMTVGQIQAFLDNKVVTCDTNGLQQSEMNNAGVPDYNGNKSIQRWEWGKYHYNQTTFPCLKDYEQDGKSAAQIIYDVSKKYVINPQVMLVLLQKEQVLITDTWPSVIQYRSATGYGCPDTAPCSTEYYGLVNQLDWAAKMFRSIMNASPGWYTPYILGNNTIQYNPQSSCGSSIVNIQNRATQALYNYTPYQPNSAALAAGYGSAPPCGAYGNRNFWLYFNDWFGSSSAASVTKCNSGLTDIVCVWSVKKSDGSQFLTPSESELSNTMNVYGWINEGIAFYASRTEKPGTTPVYRMRLDNRHHYTASLSEYTTLKGTAGWTDEGIAFYALPPSTSTNASHKIYNLRNTSNSRHYQTTDIRMRDVLLNSGYALEANTFNTLSGYITAPTPETGRNNIYMSSNGAPNNFYTSNLGEIETTVKMGYSYKGVLTTANAANSGTPIYRLQQGGRHFYTASAAERDNAVSKYGYTYEGIGFYVDSSSAQIYRLANTKNGSNLYVTNVSEVMSLTNTNGWIYEGALVNNNSSTVSSVYRFLNVLNNRHFYTIDINEATRISNKGWKYETVAFKADKSSGQPVYRLLSYDKHFYTTNLNERNVAVSNFGYTYEGVVFYVSQTPTDKPVYRLQGGNDEYFYTASSTERDTAVSKYGYIYEGGAFYLPTL